LNFGLIGSNKSADDFKKNVVLGYLKNYTINGKQPENSYLEEGASEFLIIFKEIPIKVRIFTGENFNNFIYNHDKIKNLDVIILILDIFDLSSSELLEKDSFEEFKDYFAFRNGISVLVGFNSEADNNLDKTYITTDQIIEKAKKLNVIYGYEITAGKEENLEFFDRIFEDFIFKFQYSSPELFDLANLYGKELKEESQ
jgi:hypothetical protein